MTRRTTTTVLFVSALVLGLLWAPWLSREYAEKRLVDEFAAAWQGVIDGCGFNCQGCGVRNLQRVLIGYAATIEYACGLLPSDRPDFHETRRVHVSVLGTVHGLPTP
jgi:threonine/homoserine efflux transporter RhtA